MKNLLLIPETLRTLGYKGAKGVLALLENLQRYGWVPVLGEWEP